MMWRRKKRDAETNSSNVDLVSFVYNGLLQNNPASAVTYE